MTSMVAFGGRYIPSWDEWVRYTEMYEQSGFKIVHLNSPTKFPCVVRTDPEVRPEDRVAIYQHNFLYREELEAWLHWFYEPRAAS